MFEGVKTSIAEVLALLLYLTLEFVVKHLSSVDEVHILKLATFFTFFSSVFEVFILLIMVFMAGLITSVAQVLILIILLVLPTLRFVGQRHGKNHFIAEVFLLTLRSVGRRYRKKLRFWKLHRR